MFQPLIDECKLRNYSSKTLKIYLYYNQHFLNWCRKKPQEVTEKDLRTYLLYLLGKNRGSATVNLAHNALNYYYVEIMKRKFKIPFQKKEQKCLPAASLKEINQMVSVTKNMKHKLIISLLYASGVRRSELVKIKISDIDTENRLLLVRQGKGKKDRYTILSYVVISMIQDYLKSRPYDSPYLFASRQGHISSGTVEKVITQARHKARIKTKVTPHTLRRSFATHHLVHGTRGEFIQQMLGHRDIRTTLGYERIVPVHLTSIRSPHDVTI